MIAPPRILWSFFAAINVAFIAISVTENKASDVIVGIVGLTFCLYFMSEGRDR